MNILRNPSSISSPVGPYAHQIEVQNPKRWLCISGQIGFKTDGSLPESSDEQFLWAVHNVAENLKAAEMVPEDLVKLNFFLTEPVDRAVRAEVLKRYFGDFTPCMTLVYVSGLASPDIKLEIEGWAAQ